MLEPSDRTRVAGLRCLVGLVSGHASATPRGVSPGAFALAQVVGLGHGKRVIDAFSGDLFDRGHLGTGRGLGVERVTHGRLGAGQVVNFDSEKR